MLDAKVSSIYFGPLIVLKLKKDSNLENCRSSQHEEGVSPYSTRNKRSCKIVHLLISSEAEFFLYVQHIAKVFFFFTSLLSLELNSVRRQPAKLQSISCKINEE